ncbi:MAG TPA: redoxin domain-containing protein [Hanamia sp.]|nr:redoxin domain-containing protein [Hanamia sp.]
MTISKRIHSGTIVFSIFLLAIVNYKSNAQEKTDITDTAKLRAAIEANPNNPDLHDAYIKATGFTKWNAPDNPGLVKQYEEWMKEFPTSAVIPYELGHAYANKESPKAKPYLLKAIKINPGYAKAYFDLWIDAERWGDFKGGNAYLLKAKEAEPNNPDYAFYYASSFDNSDKEKYKQLSLDVAKRFPQSERGAQALYWLGARFTEPDQRMAFYEQLRTNFAPNKFQWSSSGMSDYFDLLLKLQPEKAVSLAQSMINIMPEKKDKAEWEKQSAIAKNVVQAKSYLTQNKAAEAVNILDNTKVSRWSNAKNALLLLKAKALDASGKTNLAYDNLIKSFAKSPENEIKEGLNIYGRKMGKTEDQIENDIWHVRDTASKEATPFSLKQYLKPGNMSLSDLKGKVVLLTYWFPGCGPCRGEFPHFQNVVNKFKGQNLAYIGINILPDQNDYVLPFMKSSGYSFIPLEDVEGRQKGNLDNGGAAPVNFLLDQNGKIMFANFRIDEQNEEVLQTMISSLLNRKQVRTYTNK